MNDKEIRELLVPKLAHYVCTLGELTIGNATGDMTRADVVAFTTEAMHGFEIKGDGDTLKRVPLQLACYQRTFSRLTFVVTPKHLKKIVPMLPPGVGVWVAEADGIHEWLPAMKNAKQEPEWLLRLLWASELKELCSKYGVQVKGKAYVHERVEALAASPALTLPVLEAAVVGYLRGRMDLKAAQRAASRQIREEAKAEKKRWQENNIRMWKRYYISNYQRIAPLIKCTKKPRAMGGSGFFVSS